MTQRVYPPTLRLSRRSFFRFSDAERRSSPLAEMGANAAWSHADRAYLRDAHR
ncbi:MAG: hypothetical protein OHK0013_47350 [Sandaracinaceae bacterium]